MTDSVAFDFIIQIFVKLLEFFYAVTYAVFQVLIALRFLVALAIDL